MRGSMVDIQSPTAQRLGEKKMETEKERRKIETTGVKYNGLIALAKLSMCDKSNVITG